MHPRNLVPYDIGLFLSFGNVRSRADLILSSLGNTANVTFLHHGKRLRVLRTYMHIITHIKNSSGKSYTRGKVMLLRLNKVILFTCDYAKT